MTSHRSSHSIPVFILKATVFEHEEPIAITGKDHEFQIKLPARPEIVCIDPNATILAEWNFKQPKNMLLAQLKDSPFIVDRIRALEALTEEKGKAVVDAIGDVLKTAEFYGLRIEAAKALEKRKEDSATRFSSRRDRERKRRPRTP